MTGRGQSVVRNVERKGEGKLGADEIPVVCPQFRPSNNLMDLQAEYWTGE